MKKILYGILAVALAACAKESIVDLESGNTEEITSSHALTDHFYGTAYPDVTGVTRGIAQRENLWYPCSTIKVKFLNDPYHMADKVKTYAAEWEKYAGIHFNFVESGDAHVRIGFDWNDERYITWSYIGTDCKMVTNQQEATMSFAYWDSSTEQEIKGDVLRAFGQVLGLELEHRHLDFEAGWTARIADYWEGEIGDIPWESLQKYVFTPLERNGSILQTAEYDENSIMIWPFSSRYARNTARSFNFELSDKDKEFVGKLYPKCEEEEEPIVTIDIEITSPEYVGFLLQIKSNNDIIVDWGNAVRDTIRGTNEFFAIEFYELLKENVTVKLFGKTDALTSLLIGKSFGFSSMKVDVSRNEKLEELDCTNTCITTLNVSKNRLLKILRCGGNKLTTLEVLENINLEELDCTANQLRTLDVSNNKKIIRLACSHNQLTTLNVLSNTSITDLSCFHNQLTALDLSNNTSLTNLVCLENQLSTLDLSNNTSLVNLECGQNQLTTLVLPDSKALTNLSCSNNHLTVLDVSNNTALWDLNCSDNHLSALDVYNNIKLSYLSCPNNRLAALDVSNNTTLHGLTCFDNQLSTLKVCNTSKTLSNIRCYNNPFINDQLAFMQFVQSLPAMYYTYWGNIYINTSNVLPEIYDICSAKHWNISFVN